MKKIIIFCFMFSLVLLSCAKKSGSTTEMSEETVVFKLGHIFAEDNLVHQVSLKFAEEVDRLTDGAVKVEVYPNSLEGNEIDNINGIRLGTSDITISGESLQQWAPKAALIASPYTFKSLDHIKSAVEGEVGQEIATQIKENVGLIPIAYILRLPRNLTSNRPITTPNELNRMILRVPSVPIFVKAWEALGAKPTPMALNEVFTSLQQGTIEGQENPIDLIYTSGFQEVQDYVNLTEHVYGWLYIVIGEKQFNSLTPELQEKVLEAASIAQAFGYEELLKFGERYKTLLEESGVTFVEVDKQAFQDRVKPALEESFDADQIALYNKILAMPQQ